MDNEKDFVIWGLLFSVTFILGQNKKNLVPEIKNNDSLLTNKFKLKTTDLDSLLSKKQNINTDNMPNAKPTDSVKYMALQGVARDDSKYKILNRKIPTIKPDLKMKTTDREIKK